MIVLEILLLFLYLNVNVHGYSNGDVRLAGTSDIPVSSPPGRLEVFINGSWGTVCSVSRGAAQSVCHQLGYEIMVIYDTVTNLAISKASDDTPILLTDVNCEWDPTAEGPELHILRCSYSQQIPSYCNHDVDVAIACDYNVTSNPLSYTSEVNLVGGDSPSSGILTVYEGDEWGTACYAGFKRAAADSACRQLGYTNAVNFSGITMSAYPVWIHSTTCSGSRPCLKQCYKHPHSYAHCSDEKIVFLNCTFQVALEDVNYSGSVSLCTYHEYDDSSQYNGWYMYIGIACGVFVIVTVVSSMAAVALYVFHRRKNNVQYSQINSM